MSQWCESTAYSLGTRFISCSSTASGFLPGARPVRLLTRKMCVSTAMVGWPKATFSTTLAVLRPTPGKASSASRWRHLANSAAVLTDPGTHYDLVRPGLACYGLTPVPQLGGPQEFGLVPAMTVSAPLTLVKQVPAGQGVSYGYTYHAPHDTTLGLVPLGYADGIPRHAGNGAPVLVAGRRVPVVGRICMDQFVVDLGPSAQVAPGERAVLFGSGAGGEPGAQDWAEAAETISYEIVSRMSSRIVRRYRGGSL